MGRALAELGFEGGGGEQLARAVDRGDLLVEVDARSGDARFAAECGDELVQPLHLGGGELVLLAVTDEGDADAVGVEGLCVGGLADGVGAGLLVHPALADDELAIAEAVAVADDEVMPQTGESGGAGAIVEIFGGVEGSSGGIDHDVAPLALDEGSIGVEDDLNGVGRGGRHERGEGEAAGVGLVLRAEQEEAAHDDGHGGDQ